MTYAAGIFLAAWAVDLHKSKQFRPIVAIFIGLDQADDLLQEFLCNLLILLNISNALQKYLIFARLLKLN